MRKIILSSLLTLSFTASALAATDGSFGEIRVNPDSTRLVKRLEITPPADCDSAKLLFVRGAPLPNDDDQTKIVMAYLAGDVEGTGFDELSVGLDVIPADEPMYVKTATCKSNQTLDISITGCGKQSNVLPFAIGAFGEGNSIRFIISLKK